MYYISKKESTTGSDHGLMYIASFHKKTFQQTCMIEVITYFKIYIFVSVYIRITRPQVADTFPNMTIVHTSVFLDLGYFTHRESKAGYVGWVSVNS